MRCCCKGEESGKNDCRNIKGDFDKRKNKSMIEAKVKFLCVVKQKQNLNQKKKTCIVNSPISLHNLYN